MNASKLQSQIETTSKCLEDLQALLTEALAEQDPFAVYLFQARRFYRSVVDRDSKAGKRTEREVSRGYLDARERFGYRGSAQDWWDLLRIGP